MTDVSIFENMVVETLNLIVDLMVMVLAFELKDIVFDRGW